MVWSTNHTQPRVRRGSGRVKAYSPTRSNQERMALKLGTANEANRSWTNRLNAAAAPRSELPARRMSFNESEMIESEY
jgi:hypothetical protein